MRKQVMEYMKKGVESINSNQRGELNPGYYNNPEL